MSGSMQKHPDGTIEFTITVPWEKIQETYEHVVEEIVAQTEIAGFRKGKAPRSMVEPGLDKNKTYEEVIKHLVPKLYQDALTEAKVQPIISPEVTLKEAKEGSAWIIVAKTTEKPEVTLGDYKKALKDAKPTKIELPGEVQENKKPTLEDVLATLLPTITIQIPTILVDHEVTNQLSSLVDQTRKIGLTIEQYLSSTKKTVEDLRAEYAQQARKSLALEFGLEKIADNEKIHVTDTEITTVINTAKSPEEKASLESQKYYLASVLRRQKTLDFLTTI